MPTHSRPAKKKKGSSWLEKVILVIVLLVIVWAVYSFSLPPATTTTTRSNTAPDFTLPVVGPSGLTGQQVSLSSFRGKVVLLQFMVPECPHCQNMAPILNNLYNEFGQKNVVFLTVAGAWNGESANDAAKFIQTYHNTWTFVYDSSNSVFNLYGVSATPTFFIIAKNGQLAANYSGELSYETLATDLTRISSQ